MNAESHSLSGLLAALLYGAAKKGTVLSRHDMMFGDYVVTLTAPRAPRMPNGIECRATTSPRADVVIGGGRLIVGRIEVLPGPGWDPVPAFDPLPRLPAGPEPQPSALAGWMTAQQASPEVLLAGYVAGLVLLHSQRKRAERIAVRAALHAAPPNSTMLKHAARGEVPEPVHDLLALRDPAALIASSPAGILWLRGLVSAGYPLELTTEPALPGLRRLA